MNVSEINPGRRLADQAAIIVAGRMATIVVRIFLIVFLARVLSKVDFGVFSFVLLSYTLITSVAQLGLPESVFYFFGQLPAAAHRNLALQNAKLLALLALVSSALLIGLGFVAPYWGFDVSGLILPLVILALLELPTTILPNILIAVDRAGQAALFNLANSVIQILVVVFAALFDGSLQMIAWSIAAYGAFRFVLAAILFFRHFRESGVPLPAGIIGEQIRYSIPVGFAQMVGKIHRAVDKFVVAAFLPIAVYAEYAVGSWEIPLIPMIAYSVGSVLLPRMVSCYRAGQHRELLWLWFVSIRKVSILVVPLVILFLLIAEEFITLLFSEEYINAVVPFRIYTLILLMRVTSYTAVLKAIGDTVSISRHTVLIALINLMLSIPFVIWWGAPGAASATLLASYCGWAYFLVKIREGLGVRFRDVFPFLFYSKTLLVAVAAAIPVLLLQFLMAFSAPSQLIWKITVYTGLYLLCAFAAGICHKGDFMMLARWLRLKPMAAA